MASSPCGADRAKRPSWSRLADGAFSPYPGGTPPSVPSLGEACLLMSATRLSTPLMVPADNTEEVGLREVINDEEVEEVFAVLRKKEARMPTNWSRRYKNHVEKLKSGDIDQVAEVVRNLSIRDNDKDLSAGEKRMLNRARQILVSELTFAIGVSEDEAEKKLNEALP